MKKTTRPFNKGPTRMSETMALVANHQIARTRKMSAQEERQEGCNRDKGCASGRSIS